MSELSACEPATRHREYALQNYDHHDITRTPCRLRSESVINVMTGGCVPMYCTMLCCSVTAGFLKWYRADDDTAAAWLMSGRKRYLMICVITVMLDSSNLHRDWSTPWSFVVRKCEVACSMPHWSCHASNWRLYCEPKVCPVAVEILENTTNNNTDLYITCRTDTNMHTSTWTARYNCIYDNDNT